MPWEKRLLRAAASYCATGWRLALPVLVGAGATLIVGVAAVPIADAKSPGARYCFHGYCHRVGTLAQTDTLVGWRGYVSLSAQHGGIKICLHPPRPRAPSIEVAIATRLEDQKHNDGDANKH